MKYRQHGIALIGSGNGVFSQIRNTFPDVSLTLKNRATVPPAFKVMRSAISFDAPYAVSGSAALQVDARTTRASGQASRMFRVPSMFTADTYAGSVSPSGACFAPAQWNTMSGRIVRAARCTCSREVTSTSMSVPVAGSFAESADPTEPAAPVIQIAGIGHATHCRASTTASAIWHMSATFKCS